MWDLPEAGIEPMSPAMAGKVFNQWAAREVPRLTVFMCASYFPSRKQYNVLREAQVLVKKFCFLDSIKPGC